MPTFRTNTIIISGLLAVSALACSGKLFAIAKCQDAQGNWHYGDTAHEACGDTTITILNKAGREIDEVAPPMTEREQMVLEEELSRLEEERKLEKDRNHELKRILTIYPSAESIQQAKNSKLAGQDQNIKVQEKLLENLREELKILQDRKPVGAKQQEKYDALIKSKQENVDEYYELISRLRREREETSIKYDEILKEFNDLTNGTGDPQAEQLARERKMERDRRITQIKQQLGLIAADEGSKNKKR